MKFTFTRRVLSGVAALTAAALLMTGCAGGSGDSAAADGEPQGLKIALSNGFVNGWRLTLIDKFETAAEELKKRASSRSTPSSTPRARTARPSRLRRFAASCCRTPTC